MEWRGERRRGEKEDRGGGGSYLCLGDGSEILCRIDHELEQSDVVGAPVHHYFKARVLRVRGLRGEEEG